MLNGLERCHDAATCSLWPTALGFCVEIHREHDGGLLVVLLIDGVAYWCILMMCYILLVILVRTNEIVFFFSVQLFAHTEALNRQRFIAIECFC